MDEETYLSPRNTQETHRHKHPGNRNLIIPILNPIQVLYTQRIRRNKTIQRKDLIHLHSRHKRTTPLADNMRD